MQIILQNHLDRYFWAVLHNCLPFSAQLTPQRRLVHPHIVEGISGAIEKS